MVDNISEMNKVTTAMDNIDSLILVADLDYNLIYINRKLAETFGVDVERYKGKKCYRTLKEFDQPCSVCQMHKILPDKHLFPSRNYEFVYDDVLDAWMGGRSSIIRWVDGSMVYFQSAHNETEKKKSQEQLSEALQSAEKALSAKTLFLANMSHEIRTPLNVIIALTDLQLEESGLTEEIKDNLHKIHIAGNTLLSIVNDILDNSKIDSGSFVLSPVEYHLASLLNDTTTLITSRIMDKPIAFFLNINDDLPSKLYGDDLRVKQILHNLLSNAIKYTHTGTIELSVDCVREGDNDVWMDIAVKDSGIGIHKEDLEKIFFDFNQVDTKANRKIEGTGLGLPITKKLAENMGGGISVESEHGKGSTFRVRIRQGFVSDTPIGLEIVENLRKLRYYENKRHFASSLVRVDLSYAKVLVVDDLQANLEVAAGLMRKYKMQVDCVNSGQAAIQRIEIGEPIYNAIFMDHMMPEMDGIEAADAIRAIDNSYARSIPIIALTANAVVGTEKLFYEHDFQAFITKPIDIMRLDSVLRQWVKTKSNNKPIDESQEKLVVPDIHVLDSLEEENDLKIEITGLDTEKGISICDGDLKIFRSVLRSYVADTSNVLDKIRDVSEESLPGYTVAVHGIKGSSANIGAEAIRAAAADLELIAKSGNLPAVLAKNDAFLKETECVVADIKGWLDKEVDKTTKQRLHAPDREVLARLRERCEDYDMDGIEQLMDELDSASYTTDADLVIWLREKIETFDLAEVAERLAEYK
jgi:signal transduction histidine kinase/DNA-binding response OmpR family regulator/HPt (histidine-containing phosphotransfer) domain-containing protein